MIIILKNIKGNKKIWKFLNHGQLGQIKCQCILIIGLNILPLYPLPINCTLCLQFIPLPLTAHSVSSCTPPRSFPHRSRVYWQSGREPQIRLPPRSSTQTAGYGPYPGSCPSKPRPCSPGKPWLQTTKSPRPAVELWRKKKLQGMLDESGRNGQYDCVGSSHSFHTCTIYAQSLKGKWNNIRVW